ncbi:UUP1 family membrane protein [Gallaecimonas sp. GXIMD4217]|uniref:UUP1 family membrane protein n=1 Tax=Gallaecimonas sp. GXIMD4217 TaxID=3131927 RepID=UPI00311AC486
MINRASFYVIVLLLIVGGLSLAWLRHSQMELPFTPGEERPVWLVEARVDFNARDRAVLASLDLPDNPPGFRLFTEQAASPGYGFSVIEHDGNRRGEWSIRRALGPQTLYYKAQFIADPDIEDAPEAEAPEPALVDWDEPQATAAAQLLSQASTRSSSPQSLARELMKLINQPEPGQNAALLLANHSPAELLNKLVNQAGIPARVSLGLYLEDARRRQSLTPMVEIYADQRWLVFDPKSGQQGLPENLLLWHRGGESLLDVTGGSGSSVSFAIIKQTVPALQLARAQAEESGFSPFSLYRLPIEEQSMFKMLLLLPLGAFVVVLMRIVVGIKTSGTFMPVLIAVAFLQTSLVPGMVSFIAVVAFGLLLRGYLSRLNLLLVARIATLVILVVFIIAIMSLVGYQLGFNTGMTITFFPMIIMAWTIERMSILWEEDGPREVLIQGSGSLLVAVLAYLAMQSKLMSHLTFNFPELHLVLLAFILLIGQYTGYKLSELKRFRAMVEND